MAILLFFGGQQGIAFDLPRLSISNGLPQSFVSWPVVHSDWVLERSTNVGRPADWMTVSPASYQTLATMRYASIAATQSLEFFRLRRLGAGMSTLTGYWPFEEGDATSSLDFSSRGTPMNHMGVSMAPGRMGRHGLRFNGGSIVDGSRAWLSNTNYRVLPGGAPFSVSLWFNPESTTGGPRALMGSGTDLSSGWRVLLETPGPGTNLIVFSSAGPGQFLSVTGRTLLLPNRWHQLTVTHDGTEGFLYLNSALLARGRLDLENVAAPIYFGGGIAHYDSFLGTIDEVRTFADCLNEEEISLTGYWKLNEGAGELAVDSSMHGRHAGVVDAAAWMAGREGAAVDLACGRIVIRNDDFGVLPSSGGAFSISMWLRPNSVSTNRQELMRFGGTTNGWQLRVWTDPGGESWVEFSSTNQGGTLALETPLALTNGAWTKLDVTFDGGVGTLYANGRPLRTASGAIQGSRSPILVGGASGTLAFDGIIDELKIFSRERSAAEIGPLARTLWETVLVGMDTNFVLQGFGPAGRPLTYNIVSVLTPTNGTVSLVPGSGSVVYRAGGRKGPDAFAYTVSDGEFTSPPAIVTVSVVQPHWLSPQGGPLSPADGSNPAHAWAAGDAAALDAVWRTNDLYDCFFYAPGTYQTKGWKWLERYTANPGCKHIGSGASGSNQTTIKLVEVIEDSSEGIIFVGRDDGATDGFEVRNMVLDCNATNVPKWVRGQPVWMRIPLTTTGVVESVTLRWGDRAMNGRPDWKFGAARSFKLCGLRSGTNSSCTTVGSTGGVDVVSINAEVDELLIEMEQRGTDVDFYSLIEVGVTGGIVSLPSATLPGGIPSPIDAPRSIFSIADGDAGTAWTSGLENEVEIALPLSRGTPVNQIQFNWNCKTIAGVGRFGAAAEFRIQARDAQTGILQDAPFIRHGRASSGLETITFGTPFSTNDIITDQIVLILTAKEAGVDFFSLRDIKFWKDGSAVSMRIPSARATLVWGNTYAPLRAFDGDAATDWASHAPGQVSAIQVFGSNLKFTNLRVVGFGTHAGSECFPMFLGRMVPGRHYVMGNVLVEDCVLTEPAPKNKDGLTALVLLAAHPNILTNAMVRRCSVLDVQSQFTYSHAFSAADMENSLAENCDVAVYFEPGAPPAKYGPINLRSNTFLNVTFGIYWLFHAGAQFDDITCRGNEIVLNGRPGFGIAACDACSPGPSGAIKGLTALNNVIRYADWGRRPFGPAGGILYSDIAHSVVGNNVIMLGTSNELRVRQYPAGYIPPHVHVEDCDYLPPPPVGNVTYPPSLDQLPIGYQRAWFNNRSLSGSLLDVRFSSNGSDRNASQQQWLE